MNVRTGLMRCLIAFCFLLMTATLMHCGKKECYYDSDCTDGKVCLNDTCQDATVTGCKSDGDCSGGQKCVAERCVLVPPGFEFPKAGEEPKEAPPEGTTPDGGVDGGEPITKEGGPEIKETVPDVPPKACQTSVDCKDEATNKTCGLLGDALVCVEDHPTGKSFGETCDPAAAAPGDCRSKVCHPDTKRCTLPCKTDADCPGGKGQCKEVDLNGNKVKICGGDTVQQCALDAHCTAGDICRFSNDADGNPVFKCGKGGGSIKDLQTCIGNGECQRSLCIAGSFCAKPCLTNADCGTDGNYVCRLLKVSTTDNPPKTSELQVCQLPEGGLKCTDEKDCLHGYPCVPSDANGTLETRCLKGSGTKAFGEDCTKDDDCSSNFCLPSGKCSVVCKEDKDCQKLQGIDAKCADVSLTRGTATGTAKSCVFLPKACTKDSDCSANEVCAPYLNDDKSYDLRCIQRLPAATGKADGQTCAQNGDCLNAYCNNSKCESCQKDSDCGGTRSCFNGRCTDAKRVGKDCADHEDCLGRICFQKRCSQICSQNSDCTTPGFACDLDDVEQGGSKLNTRICVVPQGGLPCTTDADCPSAQEGTCRIVEVNGKMLTRCKAKVGTGKTGDSCTADADCLSGTCLLPDGICTASCAQDSDCQVGLLRCTEKEFKPAGGGSGSMIKICQDQVCKGHGDCKAVEICLHRTNGGTGFLRCALPDSKKKKQGEACTQDSDCQSGLCLKLSGQNICTSACEGGNSSPCPLQYTCQTTGTGPNGLHLCEPTKDACVKDGDCSGGSVCVLSFEASGRPVRTCKAKVGSFKIGDLCDPQASPSQCENGYCDPKTSRCIQMCAVQGDCPQGDYRCATATINKASGQTGPDWTLTLCRSTICTNDGQCSTGEVCRATVVNNKLQQRCETPSGGKVGDTCAANSDCASGLCRNGKCVRICSADRHCQPAERCENVPILPGISSKGCVTGTRGACAGDADCPTGEICQVNVNPQNGAVSTACRVPKAAEKTKGQPCTPGSYPGDCASHLCDPVTKTCLQTCQPGLLDCRIGTEVCNTFPLPVTGAQGPAMACTKPDPACTKGSDCTNSTVCSAKVDQQNVTFTCSRINNTQTKKVGDACNANIKFPGECQTHLCHPVLKVCVNTCTQDSDCTDASRPKCGKILLSGGQLANACIPSQSPCDYDGTCPASEPICALEIVNNALVKRCSTGGPGTKKTGESCDPSKKIPGDCANRFCEEGTLKCVATCNEDAHCPQGLKCISTPVEGNRSAKACIRPAGSTCEYERDCSKPTICQAVRETTGIVGKCLTPLGLDNGLKCTPKELSSGNYGFVTGCKSQICHPDSKRCTTICRTNADCPVGHCETMMLEGFPTKVCNAACEISSDCHTGEICGPVAVPGNNIERLCRTPDAQLKPLGAACDPSKILYAECQSGFCSPVTSKCTTFCKQDTDCGTGEICDTSFVRVTAGATVTVQACVPSTGGCTHNSQCFNDYYCAPGNRNGSAILLCLKRSQSALATGGACNPAAPYPQDCVSRLCDPQSKQCTEPCRSDADCTQTPRTKCGTISILGASFPACTAKP